MSAKRFNKRSFSLGLPSCNFIEITGNKDKIEEAKNLVAQSGGKIVKMLKDDTFYYVYNEKI